MQEFYIGQIFEDTYPPQAAIWCNNNQARIDKTDYGFVIVDTTPSLEQQARQAWEQEFYALDKDMPRYAEDIIDALDNKNKISKEAKERAERKKELRAEGKSKGYI
jgi:hypothetical protein